MKEEGRVANPRRLYLRGVSNFLWETSTAQERKNGDVDLEKEHQSSEVTVLRTL